MTLSTLVVSGKDKDKDKDPLCRTEIYVFFCRVVLFKWWMKLFKIAGKNLTVQERSLMHRNQPKLRTSLSGAHIHLVEHFHLNIDPILFYLSSIHCSIHTSTGKFPFEIFSFITHESTRVHIYWGLQSEGTMPLHGNRGQICFSWVLASQDPIHSNNCRADGLPGYMYRIRKP